MSTSRCGEICITPPKSIRDERRRGYYSGCSVVAAGRRQVLETLCFVVKEKLLCLGFQMSTTRNQWLSYIYNTVPEQYNPNIGVCAAQFTEDYILKLEE